MPSREGVPEDAALGIVVLAGVNGAGKSSVAGRMIEDRGAEFINPDQEAKLLQLDDPTVELQQANSVVWQAMLDKLNRVIDLRQDFEFETTLGGRSITAALQRAIAEGIDVRVWYVGLRTVEDHIARVRARVAAGGHDIPEEKIRERYVTSPLNLIKLLPGLRELWVYDNTAPAEPPDVTALLVLHMADGEVCYCCPPGDVPAWAKPILAVALDEQSS
jgi:predicted ABC-type ATPase